MRHLTLSAIALLMLTTTGCMAGGARSRAYASDQPTARAAVDGNGDLSEAQELAAFNLPLGPFTLKAGLIWNGETWVVPVPGASAAPYADPCYAPAPQAAPCAEAAIVEEPYTVRVPVQTWREETRVRRYRVETYSRKVALPSCECAPAPQAAPCTAPQTAPRFAPVDPPPAQAAPQDAPPTGK